MVLTAVRGGAVTELLKKRWLNYLGKISYGIYVYHYGIGFMMKFLVKQTIGESYVRHHLWLEGLLFLASSAIIITAAHLSYYFFEERFIKLKNKIGQPKVLNHNENEELNSK